MNVSIFTQIRRNYKSFLTAFLIFLYGLANIGATFGQTHITIIILSAIFIVPYMIKNYKRLPLKFSFFIILFLSLFVINKMIFPENEKGQNETFISFFSLGIVGMYCGSLKFDISKTLFFSKFLAYANFAVNIFYIIFCTGDIDTISMRFGYGILPSAMFFLVDYFNKQSYKSLFLFLVCFSLIFIWGSRGCLLVIILFLLIYNFKKNPIKTLIIILLIFVLSSFFVSYLENIIDILPIESYKLRKMKMTLDQGIVAASSGRDKIYALYWSVFLDNIWGIGIGCQYLFSDFYPHNLYIQTAVELGFIGLILMVIYTIFSLRKIVKQNYYVYLFLLVVYSITFGRLFLSSNFWDRPEFWYLFAIVFINPTIIHKRIRNRKHHKVMSRPS